MDTIYNACYISFNRYMDMKMIMIIVIVYVYVYRYLCMHELENEN